jgi:IPT/TIG domain
MWQQGYFRALLLCFFAVLGVLVAYSHTSAEACQQIAPGGTVPTGYSAPYRVHAGMGGILMAIDCPEAGQPTLAVGSGLSNEYIYEYAYQWSGTAWQRLALSGASKASIWFIGSATTPIAAVNPGSVSYVVAYVCTLVSGTWKCGCRDAQCATPGWQLQSYRMPDESTNPLSALSQINDLMIAFPSRYSASPGEVVRLTGAAFSTEATTVELGSAYSFSIPARSRTSLDFTVPAGATPGEYPITVRVGSAVATTTAPFIITAAGSVPPTITGASPTQVRYGQTVTITGTGFTPTGNTIYAGPRVFKNIPSADGTTLRVVFGNISFVERGKNDAARDNVVPFALRIPIHPTIANANGVSIPPTTPTFTVAVE